MISDPKVPPSAAQNAYVRICPACSQAFEPPRRWQRFCAPRCRAREHRRSRSPTTSARSVAVVVFDNGSGYLDDFQHFAVSVSERLQKGQESYQGRSFSAEPRALIGEIRDELRDVAGWAFVLDCRLARVAEALEQASVTTAGETDRCTETAAPTSASSRDADGDRRAMPRARDARHQEGS
jgi:hypothetical protein